MAEPSPPAIPLASEATGVTADPTGVTGAITLLIAAVIGVLAAFDIFTADQRSAISTLLVALLGVGILVWTRRHAWSPGSVIELADAVRAGER